MGQIDKEMSEMKKEAEKQFRTVVVALQKEIVSLTPVDTGNLKGSINDYGVKGAKDKLRISSNQESDNYSYSLMIKGRRMEGGIMRGSLQLPMGILPYVRSAIKNKNITFKQTGASI